MKVSLPPAPWDASPAGQPKPVMNRLGGMVQRGTYATHAAEARALLKAPGLTKRQRAILEARVEGLNTSDISQMLGISDGAIRYHVSMARKRATP